MNFNMDVNNFFLASVISMEDFENKLDNILSNSIVYKSDIDELLESHGLSFWSLPQYLQEKIDEVDIVLD